jgi:hypothetical protein
MHIRNCLRSNKDSVVVPVPYNLESVVWVKQRFCGRSRNSGLVVLGHTKVCGRSRNSGIGNLDQT